MSKAGRRKSDENWRADQRMRGWVMPCASGWKRFPFVRNIRAAYHSGRVARHNRLWGATGGVPTGYDAWVLYGMARGFERAPGDAIPDGAAMRDARSDASPVFKSTRSKQE